MEWLLLCLPIIIPLVNTLLNLFTWPTGSRSYHSNQKISVLIPVRNEERNIEECIEQLLNSCHSIHEIIICDDRSQDNTPTILKQYRTHPLIKIKQSPPLPQGWIGKPHACHCLASYASGDILLFIDADVRIKPDGIHRIVDLMRRRSWDGQRSDIVTAVPQQQMVGRMEKLLLPLLLLSYTSWLPMIFVRLFQTTKMTAANGQVLAITRTCYDQLGGFAAIRKHIVDDMALCRRAKEHGAHVLFADGQDIAQCRMYHSRKEIWEGFSKNIYRGIGGKISNLLLLILLYTSSFVFPYLALCLSLASLLPSSWFFPALFAVFCNLMLRILLAKRYNHTWWSILLHPFAVLYCLSIAINSYWWNLRGNILWRGRQYSSTEIL